jgi:hypothetical protein
MNIAIQDAKETVEQTKELSWLITHHYQIH